MPRRGGRTTKAWKVRRGFPHPGSPRHETHAGFGGGVTPQGETYLSVGVMIDAASFGRGKKRFLREKNKGDEAAMTFFLRSNFITKVIYKNSLYWSLTGVPYPVCHLRPRLRRRGDGEGPLNAIFHTCAPLSLALTGVSGEGPNSEFREQHTCLDDFIRKWRPFCAMGK